MNFLQTEHVDPIFRRIVGEFLAIQEKPYMQRTVKEFLWGYQDPLLKLLKEVFPKIVANDEVSVFYASVILYKFCSYFLLSKVLKVSLIIQSFNLKYHE